MKQAMMKLALSGAMVAGSMALAQAEPIEGKWLRPSTGTLVNYARSGNEFCGTVLSGEHAGKSIGCMTGSGSDYKGKVIALDEGKTYTGKAKITGASMKLEGCVFVICKGETWQRQ